MDILGVSKLGCTNEMNINLCRSIAIATSTFFLFFLDASPSASSCFDDQTTIFQCSVAQEDRVRLDAARELGFIGDLYSEEYDLWMRGPDNRKTLSLLVNEQTISVCLVGKKLTFGFGGPDESSVVKFAVPLESNGVDVQTWSGVGRYINESVTLRDGAHTYTSAYGLDRLHPSCLERCDIDSGLRILKNGEQVAVHRCDPTTLEQSIHLLGPVSESKRQ